jgi:acetylornithine deacetylase/succinyl-diaminopimelate desuccinylase-like protein
MLGYPARPIVSGAGHDAVYMSYLAPTGMIFIPCKDAAGNRSPRRGGRPPTAAARTGASPAAARWRRRRRVYMSYLAPTGMIFIPCKDGISHNEMEYASPEHVAAA